MDDPSAAVRRFYDESINKQNLDVLDELLHPEYRSVTADGEVGIEGAREVFRGIHRDLLNLREEVEFVFSNGDRVGIFHEFTGTTKRGDTRRFRVADFYQVKDGKLWRHWDVFEPDPRPRPA